MKETAIDPPNGLNLFVIVSITPVRIHPDARKDLEDLLRTDTLIAKRIAVQLQELKSNKELFRKLWQDAYRDTESDRIDIKKWIRLQNEGELLWRLKITDLEHDGKRFRVIYTFIASTKVAHILAIVKREHIDYDDPAHPLTARILRARHDLRANAESPKRSQNGQRLNLMVRNG